MSKCQKCQSKDQYSSLTLLLPLQVIVALVAAVAVSSASAWGVSSQFQKQDAHGGYAYGYEDPNSQKQEQRSAGGVVQGGYSYVDGAGEVQHVKYVADPKSGFHIVGASNLPEAQRSGAGVPNDGRFGYDFAQIRIGHGGVPIDTPEVQAARAKHLAALSQAHQSAPYQGHERRRRSLGAGPIDTPEVQHARAQHFAALNAAASGHEQSYNTGSIKHVVVPYHGPQHNVALHQGVPVDTPEVIHARQKHFNAWGNSHAAAQAAGQGEEDGEEQGAGQWQGQGQNWNQGGQASWQGNQGNQGNWNQQGNRGAEASQGQGVSPGDYYRQAPELAAYKGPIHVPVIHKGVPVETPEVIQARAAHLSAFAKAAAEAGPYVEEEEGHQQNEQNQRWN